VAAQNTVVNTTVPAGTPGTVTTSQWSNTAVWQLVANDIQSLTFTGYDQNMQPTT